MTRPEGPAALERLRHRLGDCIVHDVGAGALLAERPAHWDPEAAAPLTAQLIRDLPWGAHSIRLFGRTVAEPRLSCWLGSAEYSYSGRRLEPSPMPPVLQAVADELSTLLEFPLTGVLANLYRDGDDAMGWHADDERELGPEPLIASVSLGATRRFRVKARAPGSRALTLSLASGSLLVMAGRLQRTHVHALPRMKGVSSPRVNLTFRWFPA